jgi:hypothetical protein
MSVELSSLRVSADLDAAKYTAGADQKVAADKAMIASSQATAAAFTQTDTKISQSGDVLNRLSKQYVDGFASAQKFEGAINSLARGVETGKISITQTGPILDGIYQRYGKTADAASFAARGQGELALAVTAANTRFVAAKPAVDAHSSALGIGNTQTLALVHSLRSFGEQMALGIPVTQAAVGQLNHLSYAMTGEDGLLAAAKKAGPAVLAAIGGVTGAVAIGFGIAAVAAEAYYLLSQDKTKSLTEALKDERQAILDVAAAYDLAKVGADNYNKSAGIFAGAALRKDTSDLSASARLTNAEVIRSLTSFVADGYQSAGKFVVPTGHLEAKSQYSAFAGPIDQYAKGGGQDYDALARGVQDVVAQNPGLKDTGDKILNIAKAGADAGATLKEAADTLARINGRYPSLTDAQSGQAYRDQSNADLTWAQRQQSAALGRIGAKSPEELRQAAMAAEAAKPSPANESAEVTQYKIAGAGALAYAQALHQLKEAQDQRTRALDQTLDSAKLDVDLIGQSTAATEGLRMAFQLEQQVRGEAARNNTQVDEAEIARIKEKAAEYGKLKALQEARDTIHTQEIDLETQKAEVATVGENTLARQRAAAALKTEQDIRKLGIPLYGQEANAMRANTAALSDQAAALAKASLQADLLFERSQILRNSDDQAIASRLQSAGLPVDLNSAEANMMRYNMALQETKDTFKGFATDMLSSLEQGKSLWESFGDAARNALAKIADKLIDRGLDGIFNSLFGGQSAGGGLLGGLLNFGNGGSASQQSTPTGGASSFLGKLFGAGGQSVASMQVQAAVVNVNGGIGGGVGGGLSDILSKLGSPSFKADTTLSDILGYGGGAANQNMIQSRIDQAFGTGGSAQDMIQSRIDQAFGTAGGVGGIFSGGGLTGSIGQYASAIKAIESAGSGGYSALGPVLRNGDQALGAYQVMNSNLPSWSTQAFGSPMSKSDFMSNPAAQDAIFEQQFGKLLNKYGNSNDAASAWFTGGPLSAGANKSDVLGTTGSAYVDKFNTALQKVTGTASQATGALGSLGGASESLISQFSKMGQSLLSQLTPATSSTSWFQGLSSMFGGSAGALGYMNSISPAATGDILSGSWGLFDDGGYTGSGGRRQPAGIVHRGEVVWSQEDIARAGGVHVVEGMRRGYAGYADGGVVRSRMRWDGTSSPRQTSHSAANDRPAQTINQTINYNLNERPMSPASQNQNAARNAKALERLQRTA